MYVCMFVTVMCVYVCHGDAVCIYVCHSNAICVYMFVTVMQHVCICLSQ